MIKMLLQTAQYNGRYVAMKDFQDHTVVGDGETPQEAHAEAVEKGYKNPVMTFVPVNDMVQIY